MFALKTQSFKCGEPKGRETDGGHDHVGRRGSLDEGQSKEQGRRAVSRDDADSASGKALALLPVHSFLPPPPPPPGSKGGANHERSTEVASTRSASVPVAKVKPPERPETAYPITQVTDYDAVALAARVPPGPPPPPEIKISMPPPPVLPLGVDASPVDRELPPWWSVLLVEGEDECFCNEGLNQYQWSFPDDPPSSWGDAQEASAADLACPPAPPMLDRVVMEQELARLAERAGVWKEFSSPESGTVWCHEPTGTFSNTIPGDLVLLRGRCDELRGCLAAVVGGADALGLKRMMVKSPSGARPALPLVVPHGAPPLLLPPAPLLLSLDLLIPNMDLLIIMPLLHRLL